MKIALSSIALCACLVVTAHEANSQISSYALDVKDFHELKVSDGVNVNYKSSTDSAGMAVFEADPAMAPMILFSNDKNRLTIQLSPEAKEANTKGLPTITVYSSILEKIENNADSTVIAEGLVPVAKFKATIIGNGTLVVNDIHAHEVKASINTGSGHLVLTGQAQRANYQNVGVGPIEAGMLKAQYVNCKMLGTGPIDCCATEQLKVLGAGSGKVIYDGNPKNVINRSIGVKIINLNEKPEGETAENKD